MTIKEGWVFSTCVFNPPFLHTWIGLTFIPDSVYGIPVIWIPPPLKKKYVDHAFHIYDPKPHFCFFVVKVNCDLWGLHPVAMTSLSACAKDEVHCTHLSLLSSLLFYPYQLGAAARFPSYFCLLKYYIEKCFQSISILITISFYANNHSSLIPYFACAYVGGVASNCQ